MTDEWLNVDELFVYVLKHTKTIYPNPIITSATD